MNPRTINALRRFAAGKRINRTMMNQLIDHGLITHDEYDSPTLTARGVETLKGK